MEERSCRAYSITGEYRLCKVIRGNKKGRMSRILIIRVTNVFD